MAMSVNMLKVDYYYKSKLLYKYTKFYYQRKHSSIRLNLQSLQLGNIYLSNIMNLMYRKTSLFDSKIEKYFQKLET